MSSTSRSSSPSPATPEALQAADFNALILDNPQPFWDSHDPSSLAWAAKDRFQPQHSSLLSLDDIIKADACEPPREPPGGPHLVRPIYSLHHASLSQGQPALHDDPLEMAEEAPSSVNANGTLRSRRRDKTAPNAVVSPPRDSCSELLIAFPSLPVTGAKSRVETQIRMDVDLANVHMSCDTAPGAYARVGSWKWLRLPPGTTTKKRPRREAKTKASAEDILDLSVEVVCASNPDTKVICCDSCRQREAKRTARKVAARVRPARSESDERLDERPPIVTEEDNVVQFNCPEVSDFSGGTAVLPVRIICYCRHHKEKVGFNILFTLRDRTGRLVGSGATPPIMITDDHKSNAGVKQTHCPSSGMSAEDGDDQETSTDRALRRRNAKNAEPKRRAKPYDRIPRAVSISSAASTAAPVTPVFITAPPSPILVPENLVQVPGQNDILAGLTSLRDDSIFLGIGSPQDSSSLTSTTFSSPPFFPTPKRSPSPSGFPPFPLLFGLPPAPPPFNPRPLPKIHRLIPSSGPTLGGVEVTVLGSNFQSPSLSCLFGGTRASATQRWSENTLVCILPPRATPGPVTVTIERLEDGAVSEDTDVCGNVFTYTDESDRALMELALQLVGLQLNNCIEDAKTVALRIISQVGSSQVSGEVNGLASMSLQCLDPRRLLLQYGRITDLQAAIIDFLSYYFKPDADHSRTLSHPNATGLTLLHIATSLNLSTLVSFLIKRGVDLNVRDNNGFSALHFAVLGGARECAQLLLRAGAERGLRTRLGQLPEQLAGDWLSEITLTDVGREPLDDEEADWVTDDEDDEELQQPPPSYTPSSPAAVSVTRRRHRAVSQSDISGDEITEANSQDSYPSTPSPLGSATPRATSLADEKHAGAGLGWLHRKLAHLQAPQGMIPNMPAVPWAALPQIPVFYVPIPNFPGWAGLRWPDAQSRQQPLDQKVHLADQMPQGMLWAVYGFTVDPILAGWEKLTAQVNASNPTVSTQDDQEPTPPVSSAPPPRMQARIARSLGYDAGNVADSEVNSFGSEVQTRRRAKQDRMFLRFWLPSLLLGFMWALYTVGPAAYGTMLRAMRKFIPLPSETLFV